MKAVTFGEIMMRLNPEGYLRFVQANSFEVSYAGGEANVAVSLANYGVDAAFVSKVPAHEIGQCVVNELRRYGVDTKYLLRGGPRLGVYYCEKGASQRASKVIYDRAGSSIATAKAEEFAWDGIFEGADWVPLDRNYSCSGRRDAGSLPAGVQGRKGKGRDRFLRPQLQKKAVVARAGRRGHGKAAALC